MPNLQLPLALSLIIIILTTANRFDKPFSAREYTTATRYYGGLLLYVTLTVLLYAFLFRLFHRHLSLGSSSVVFALAGTLIAVRAPIVSRLDEQIRAALRMTIGVPGEAHRLARILATSHCHPGQALELEVKSVLLRRGFDTGDNWLPAANAMRELWFESAVLFYQTRDWQSNKRYRNFAIGAGQEFDILRYRFDQLSLKVVRVLKTIERLGEMWEQSESVQADSERDMASHSSKQRLTINELIADLHEDITFFHSNLCRFAARGILTSAFTERGRAKQLKLLGFEVASSRPSTASVLGWAFLFYALAFIVVLVLPAMANYVDMEAVNLQLLKVAMIAAIQVSSLAVAIIPKRYFGFANEDLSGRTPWSFVLGAGIAAVVVGVPIQLLFQPYMNGPLSQRLPWLLVSFATAASVSFLIQDSRWCNIGSPYIRRLRDAIVMTAGVGLSIGCVRGILFVGFNRGWSDRVVSDLCLIAIIGLGIGYAIPSIFRRGVQRRSPKPCSQVVANGQLEMARPITLES